MVIRRVSPLSCAKVVGALYALIGLLIGACISLVAIVAGSFSTGSNSMHSPFPMAGMLFGAGAIVIVPIFYGVLGAVFSALSAVCYNIVAGMVGGIQFDVQVEPMSPVAP